MSHFCAQSCEDLKFASDVHGEVGMPTWKPVLLGGKGREKGLSHGGGATAAAPELTSLSKAFGNLGSLGAI